MVRAKDLKTHQHQIELSGEKYKLSFDMNALGHLEEHYGSMEEAFKRVLSGTNEDTKVLLWAGINAGLEDEADYLSIKEVGKLVGLGQVAYVVNEVPKLFINSLPDEKEAKTKKTPSRRK
ncbi:hypothetical protein BED47_00780 [Gottfriedia luciferensis]|uniref:Phage protein n=1 Tax=Gottfriedia luciferensis TaxID=178774 RepID=A0ABX2ZVC7_9BACI|nr:hypothetical protein [Gottfriedia luciferensis]ODG93736.1 hypothetical protein BED47_00780 [Gottfriedia luciferensis]